MKYFLTTLSVFLFFDGFAQITGHTRPVTSVCFSPDGNLLASGSSDNSIKLWKVNDGTLIKTIKGHTDIVVRLMFSPDGNLLASGSKDQTIKLWRVRDGTLLQILRGHLNFWDIIAFSPDSILFATATGGLNNIIKLWRVNDGKLIKTLQGHTDIVSTLNFSPDGNLLASGSNDKTIKLWQVTDGALIKTIKTHNDFIIHVRFSPDGNLLSSISDNAVKFWRAKDGTLTKTIVLNNTTNFFLRISPDWNLFASGSRDKTIKLRQFSNEDILKTLTGHAGLVLDADFSPDRNLLASGSEDKSIILWDVKTGTLIRIFEEKPTTYTCLSGIFMVNSNNPAPYTDIVLLNVINDTISKTVTNEKGEFRFEQLEPDKQYYLVPFDANFKFSSKAFFYLINDNNKSVIKSVINTPIIAKIRQNCDTLYMPDDSKSILNVDFTGTLNVRIKDKRSQGNKIYIINDQNEILYAITIAIEPEVVNGLIRTSGSDKSFNFKNVLSDEKFTFKTNFTLENGKMMLFDQKGKIIKEIKLSDNGTFEYQMIPPEKVITVIDEEGNKVKVGDGQRFNIYNILFDVSKWDLSDNDKAELDKIAKILALNPNIAIELNGHTDCRSDAKTNKELSGKRVMAAVQYLVSKKLEPNRIYGDGYGEEQPLNKCVDGVTCTEEEYAVNRRLEIIIRKTK